MKMRLFTLVSLLVLVIAGCDSQQAPQQLMSQKVAVRLATLSGSASYPSIKGKATYKVDNNGIREFETGIENALALKGRVLGVYVNSAKVGSMTINTLGVGKLRLVGSTAPAIAASSTPTIRIRTSAGALVASGVMNQFK
jgi:hypothetical protein